MAALRSLTGTSREQRKNREVDIMPDFGPDGEVKYVFSQR
jgi:hypothetical protein